MSVKVRRVRPFGGDPIPSDGQPWICDWRSYDIPETVAQGIRNAAPGLVAITLSLFGGRKMIFAAERAAHDRGIRVLWWFGPGAENLSDEARLTMREWIREAKQTDSSKPCP